MTLLKNNVTFLIDPTIVSEQCNLRMADADKVRKYLSNQSLMEKIKEDEGVQQVQVMSATLSCRGIWSKESANILLGTHVINRRDLKTISSRVIIGGLACFHQFMSSTSVRRRGGIG